MQLLDAESMRSCGTIRGALVAGTRLLGSAGGETPRLDAEVLLRHALGMNPAEFYQRLDKPLSPRDELRFQNLLRRRADHEPVAYITGRKEFWSLEFAVTPDVLIPRPETEILVEAALEHARAIGNPGLEILDLGTGSGVIAVCLAKELARANVTATDLSPAALQIARENALRHGVAGRIRFVQADLLAGFDRERFDLIVANPPYVRTADIDTRAPEVRDYEPRQALDGGADGLNAYRAISAEAANFLKPGGVVLLEIGHDMAEAVGDLFMNARRHGAITTLRDYAGKDRVIAATSVGSHDSVKALPHG